MSLPLFYTSLNYIFFDGISSWQADTQMISKCIFIFWHALEYINNNWTRSNISRKKVITHSPPAVGFDHDIRIQTPDLLQVCQTKKQGFCEGQVGCSSKSASINFMFIILSSAINPMTWNFIPVTSLCPLNSGLIWWCHWARLLSVEQWSSWGTILFCFGLSTIAPLSAAICWDICEWLTDKFFFFYF